VELARYVIKNRVIYEMRKLMPAFVWNHIRNREWNTDIAGYSRNQSVVISVIGGFSVLFPKT